MNLTEQIRALQDAGLSVKITHERCTVGDVDIANFSRRAYKAAKVQWKDAEECFPRTKPIHEIVEGNEELSTFGGKTKAVLKNAEGEVVAVGEALCAPVDPFVKYVGSVKALGRAVSSLHRTA